jgi:AcrR family transcriptional regulator
MEPTLPSSGVARASGADGAPLRRDAAEKRARLVEAAQRVFAERGTSASMEDIARAAGVGPATLYRRFPAKDALVREVLGIFFSRLIELAQQAYAQPPKQCLDVYLETVGWQLAANRGFMHGMWGELAPGALVAELTEVTDRLLEKAKQGGIDAQVTVGDIATAVWALRGVIHTSGQAAPDAWRRHAAYLLAGFRTRVEHTSAAVTIQQIATAVATVATVAAVAAVAANNDRQD